MSPVTYLLTWGVAPVVCAVCALLSGCVAALGLVVVRSAILVLFAINL